MGGDDGEIGEIGGEIVERRGMRMADARAQPARHAGAHAGRADIDHHRRLQLVDDFEQRIELPVVHREMAHDGMEVEAQHAEIADRVPRVVARNLALERIDRAPAMDDAVRVALLHRL